MRANTGGHRSDFSLQASSALLCRKTNTFTYCQLLLRWRKLLIRCPPFPLRVIEIGMIVGAVIGLLILIAPNFGLKPKPTVDGWRFPVKPTCLLLYYLVLVGGMGAVGLSAAQMLASGTTHWFAWLGFGFGFFLVPLVLADWPAPLILDGQGLLEGGCTSSRIRLARTQACAGLPYSLRSRSRHPWRRRQAAGRRRYRL